MTQVSLSFVFAGAGRWPAAWPALALYWRAHGHHLHQACAASQPCGRGRPRTWGPRGVGERPDHSRCALRRCGVPHPELSLLPPSASRAERERSSAAGEFSVSGWNVCSVEFWDTLIFYESQTFSSSQNNLYLIFRISLTFSVAMSVVNIKC